MSIYYQELKLLETSNATREHFTSDGISLSFIRRIDYELYSLVFKNSNLLLYFTIAIFGLCVFILGTLLVMSMTVKNHAELDKSSVLKKCFCLVLVSL
jgi:hypothetical protein